MTSKAVTAPTNPQGGATLSALYSTGWGLFGPAPTLWEGGSAHEPGTPPPTPPHGGQGSGNSTPPATGGNAGDQIARSLQNLIDRQGGEGRAAQLLFDENREYRARIRTLEGQLPAQGTVVLTPEQAQQWASYQAIDADPAALRTRLDTGTAAVEREQGRTLAEASGANPDVLAERLRAAGLRAEVRDIAAEGTNLARREVHVLNAEGADQGELRTYAQQHWQPFMPALFPTQSQTTPQGRVVTGQSGADTTPAGDAMTTYAQKVLAERQAAAQPTPPSGGTP
ncbi:hypothetical protein DKM44_02275 [Deinococcus irradiatisoli]|uniref:Uncharacterized protein n=1 Tax=Deinococcus irradiatisoli TaxID=2202254 RepID=A0A2Z3JLS4_9DEIO|nr:hypothetical protein [Deinococcus irradiatisoli]AWN22204.1 hypothetical protein DKM44_02275 [Deinococcus irradiatisoli]